MSDDRRQSDDRRRSGLKERTRLPAARERLLAAVDPVDRTSELDLADADGRVLAAPVTATRAVPHYRRAAMDGYAVRAADTFDAGDRSPARLTVGTAVDRGTAVPVQTGAELPDGADAVVPVERTDRDGDALSVTAAVPGGANVAPVGEDVEAGTTLAPAGHRLRPADLGVARSAGVESVKVYERPTAAVVPTGGELVERDPGPGEVVETNGLVLSRSVERWGGHARRRSAVDDDPGALGAAVEAALDADVVVTVGGTSVGERDLVPDVLADRGEVLVHGVAVTPGGSTALAVVEETPVVALPGYPVACLVNAVQFLRPALLALGRLSDPGHPTTTARLDGKVASEPGVRSFVPVRLADDERGPTAVPVRAAGAGVLSSVTAADGWTTVPADSEGLPAGAEVAVADWDRPV